MNAIDRWLSFRMKAVLTALFIASTLLPPYVAKPAAAESDILAQNTKFYLVEDGFIHKTSAVTLKGARIAYTKGIFHTVKEGENLQQLAKEYGISVQTIQWANDLKDGQSIQPNQQLRILPVDGVFHSVKSGETLISIANKYGIDRQKIAEQNNIQNGLIIVGQGIIIPGATPPKPDPVVVAVKQPAKQPAKTTTNPSVRNNFNRVEPVTKDTPAYTPSPTFGTLQKPCSDACFITQYYTNGHYALDMQERGGGPIYAAEDGTVIVAKTGWNGGYGNYIQIDNGNGRVTLYGHNKTLLVKEGDTVKRGEKIADMGNTGLVYGATGIHVHFEVIENGVKKNPLLYIQ